MFSDQGFKRTYDGVQDQAQALLGIRGSVEESRWFRCDGSTRPASGDGRFDLLSYGCVESRLLGTRQSSSIWMR